MRVGDPLEEHELPDPVPEEGEAIVRVTAAGICRSDLHYRQGTSFAGPLPLTLGHEVAGRLESVGGTAALEASGLALDDRVCVHYLVSCGVCRFCVAGNPQFCSSVQMIGKHRDGGFAQYLRVPLTNLIKIPDDVSDDAAAVMMCSTATALHALNKARLRAGETVAVFGVGGLGLSAVQLARDMGAVDVYAVDIDPDRLTVAKGYGAVPIDATTGAPVKMIREATGGYGVDVAVELLGSIETIRAAVETLAPLGRAAIAGIADEAVQLNSYRDLVGREAEVIGVSDHTMAELRHALSLAARGRLDLGQIVTDRTELSADAVNSALSRLAIHGPGIRQVVAP